jgi:hypothetical protein
MRLRRAAVTAFAGLVSAGVAATDTPASATEPAVEDCIRASNSSLDLRKEHELIAARAELLVCGAASCPDDVRAECVRRISEVNEAIPTIVFEPVDAAGADLAGVAISMDGAPLARADGAALSIDPGDHTFVFELVGYAPTRSRFVLHEGEKRRHERIVLTPVAIAASNTPNRQPQAPVSTCPPSTTSTTTADLGTRRTVGLVIGATGLASLSAAAATQISALALARQSSSEDAAVFGSGHADHESAVSHQTAALVLGGIGIVALVAGVYLAFTDQATHPHVTTSIRVGPTSCSLGVGELGLGGAF